ncbi:MAG: hypothetical protein KDH96_10260, partial [Candidatus Riesia sp.]|nr:hypothetical protein [Candidatus Riesia sp.]
EKCQDWYKSNADKGDFGANAKLVEIEDGEEIPAHYQDCEAKQREVEVESDGGVIDTIKAFFKTKVVNYTLCVDPPKYEVTYSSKSGSKKKVDPRSLDFGDIGEDADLKAARLKESEDKSKIDEILNKEDPTLKELQEAIKLLKSER